VLPGDLAPETCALEEQMLRGPSVSVHVRRADYTKIGWAVLDASYYARAMDYMRARIAGARFFIFSDDLAWCRTAFDSVDCVVVDVATARRDPTVDMRLMSRCEHHVIANSTYSWWGAWLNASPGKIVLAPDVWLPTYSDDARLVEDVLCPEWHRLSVSRAAPRTTPPTFC
jgi:hypothetical protein